MLRDSRFVQRLKEFDKDSISIATYVRLRRFIDDPPFTSEKSAVTVSASESALVVDVFIAL